MPCGALPDFVSILVSSSNIETNNQYYKITCKCVTWLCFSYPNYVVHWGNLYELCNATATKARRSFDVAGKIAFVLWRHGQRRNGTKPTMGLALLCLLLQESTRIPRARSPSRIERSRTRLPVGLRSLMCEKEYSHDRNCVITVILGQKNSNNYAVLRNLIRNRLSGTVNWWHCLIT